MANSSKNKDKKLKKEKNGKINNQLENIDSNDKTTISNSLDKKNDINLNDGSNKVLNKILNIIKKIFIIITSPIWFFWKVLFVRKPDKKFDVVSKKVQIFRILRSPITKPLKFILFIFIISLEVALVYKIRYSFVSYPLTRSSVHSYYLKDNSSFNSSNDKEINNLFKRAFDNVDKWNLDEKNKMYVILNSNIGKKFFNYVDQENIVYILDKFNSNQDFREDIRYSTKNINKTMPRLMREYSSEITNIVGPITDLTSYMTDYTLILDTLGKTSDLLLDEVDISSIFKLSREEIDNFFDGINEFSRGGSVEDLIDKISSNS